MAATARTRTLFGALCLVAAAGALAGARASILSEGGADPFWRVVPETHAMPGYPSVVADKTEDVCISVGYMLGGDGSTSEFTLLKAWSSQDERAKPDNRRFLPFSQNSLAAVSRWKFTPSAKANMPPIYTAATFAFSQQGTDLSLLRGRCQIPDLAGFIAKLQAEASRKGLNRAQMESQRYSPAQNTQPKVPPGTVP